METNQPFAKLFPVLFDLGSTGKTKVWSIEVHKISNAESHIIVSHGREGAKQQTTTRRVTEGKNIGKSNETTPYDQACSEARSIWTKKKDKGYSETKATVEDQPKADSRLPMLAHPYDKRKHDLVWPCYVQPKLNGVRCLAENVDGKTIVFHSRGIRQYQFDHLVPSLLAVTLPGDILDGEIYAHGEITFQELLSLVKDPTEDPERTAKYVKFWNYDTVMNDGFKMRRLCLRSTDDGLVIMVPTYLVADENAMREYHAQFCADGYEGTMIRSGGDEPYRMQYRSASLLKFKDFLDAEFEIIGVKECDGKDKGQGKLVCKIPTATATRHDDLTKNLPGVFNCRCKGHASVRIHQWEHPEEYIGKKLTVKFQYYSDDNMPIFPVGIAVRDYE